MTRPLAAALALSLLASTAPAGAQIYNEPQCHANPELEVIDGDTVRFQGERVRLLGFDTPETGDRAGCDEERELADRATRMLQLILTMERYQVLCLPGTTCGHGRPCGWLAVWMHGRYTIDVGSVLINSGLARPFTGEQADWCE